MASRRSKYILEFKQEAVRLVQEENLTFAQVGKDVGVDSASSRARAWPPSPAGCP